MPLPSGPVASRRAALAAGAAGLLATGCGTPGAAPRPASATRLDVDAQLAERAATLSAELLTVVRDAGRGRPDVRRRLAPLVDLHLAHLAVLPTSASAPAGERPRATGDVVTAVLDRELGAARQVRGWALDARSGPLARLLASMAAGISVHVEDVR